MSQEAIKNALATVKYPGFSRDIVSFGLVRSIDFNDGKAVIGISVTSNDHSVAAQIRDDIEATLTELPEVSSTEINVSINPAKKAEAPGTQATPTGIPGVKHVIAVASGKGGVGKSTFSSNLACAISNLIASEGKRVGLLDCDIYGPSIPLMMGVGGRPEIEDESIIPIESHGIKIMSMGFLVDDDTPVVWRGPMIQKTISQFINNVKWGDLEIIVVDLPPGTGDAQLSLVQTIPLRGAIIVTTPQLAATQVAKRGARMLEKTNVPILGVAENMSYLESPDGSKSYIFGEGGGQQTATDLGVELLGQIPLDPSIREAGDKGTPITVVNPESASAVAFEAIARTVVGLL
ncbi:MAG: Mrp/NBP35 family ATP-binding protein [Opitutaceae bacterium]|nr:Mrp/NBP35 family ATP-binding protein [Opitutaceae bacterium]